MGCGPSYHHIYDGSLADYRVQFTALKLSKKDVARLYHLFCRADHDRSGRISLLELLDSLDIDRNSFTERVFSMFDEDSSGQIDFREFVLAVWNYCTLGRASLTVFAFDLYDRDSGGYLSMKEIEQMLSDIYGEKVHSNNHSKQIIKELRSFEFTTRFDIDAFQSFVHTHQSLLFPAFAMQRMLQKKILGFSFWRVQSNKRIKISQGKYMSISEFMQLHIDKERLENIVDPQVKARKKPLTGGAKVALQVTGTHHARRGVTEEKIDDVLACMMEKSAPVPAREKGDKHYNPAKVTEHHGGKRGSIVPAPNDTGIPDSKIQLDDDDHHGNHRGRRKSAHAINREKAPATTASIIKEFQIKPQVKTQGKYDIDNETMQEIEADLHIDSNSSHATGTKTSRRNGISSFGSTNELKQQHQNLKGHKTHDSSGHNLKGFNSMNELKSRPSSNKSTGRRNSSTEKGTGSKVLNISQFGKLIDDNEADLSQKLEKKKRKEQNRRARNSIG